MGAGPAGSKRPRGNRSPSGTNLTLPCSALDNQFRMSILERLEQMERRMAEMTGSQQHKPGGGGGSSGGGAGSGSGGGQAQVPVRADGRLSCCLTCSWLTRLSVTAPSLGPVSSLGRSAPRDCAATLWGPCDAKGALALGLLSRSNPSLSPRPLSLISERTAVTWWRG